MGMQRDFMYDEASYSVSTVKDKAMQFLSGMTVLLVPAMMTRLVPSEVFFLDKSL